MSKYLKLKIGVLIIALCLIPYYVTIIEVSSLHNSVIKDSNYYDLLACNYQFISLTIIGIILVWYSLTSLKYLKKIKK